MSIRSIYTDFAGQIGVKPRIVRIETDNTKDEVLVTNFLQGATQMGFTFAPNDLAAVVYGDNSADLFKVTINSSGISLVPSVNQITGTLVRTWRGVWAEFQPGNIVYTVTGITITLTYPTVSTNGDSSVDVISMNGELPDFLKPTEDKNFIVRVRTDGSTCAAGNMFVGSGGQITFAADASNSDFSGTTNNIGFFGASVTYNIG